MAFTNIPLELIYDVGSGDDNNSCLLAVFYFFYQLYKGETPQVNVSDPKVMLEYELGIKIPHSSRGYSIAILEQSCSEHFNLDYVDLDDETEVHHIWKGQIPVQLIIAGGHAWAWTNPNQVRKVNDAETNITMDIEDWK